MREFLITVLDEVQGNTLCASTVPRAINPAGISGEHNATRLVFILPDAWDSTANYFVECEPSDAPTVPSDILSVTERDGKSVVAFDIPQAMAVEGTNTFVLKAVKFNEDGETVEQITRSAQLEVVFGKSTKVSATVNELVQAVVEALLGDAHNLIERFNNGEFNGEKGEKGDTGAQGPKGDKGDTGAQGVQGIQGEKGDRGDNATINGVNILLFQQGKGIVFEHKDNVLTIGSNSIPRVYELPETAEKGEICLYNTPALLSQRDELGRVLISLDELRTLSTREDSGSFEIFLRKNGIDTGYFQMYYDGGSCCFYHQTYDENSVLYGVALQFSNGVFDTNNSSIEENGEYTSPDLSAYPEAYTLPEFDSIEYNADGDLPERFGNMCHLMEYDDEWKEVSSLLKINDKLLELINAVADINGSVDEIEAIIDESGVLE